MSGTELAYGGVFLRACYAISGTDIVYGATREGASISQPKYLSPRVLRNRYAMSGTDRAYAVTRSEEDDDLCRAFGHAGTGLRAEYAMSGTEIGYCYQDEGHVAFFAAGSLIPDGKGATGLRERYAMSGYGAMTQLCDVRYGRSV
eukprot:1090819-Rhodomonas_salina.3